MTDTDAKETSSTLSVGSTFADGRVALSWSAVLLNRRAEIDKLSREKGGLNEPRHGLFRTAACRLPDRGLAIVDVSPRTRMTRRGDTELRSIAIWFQASV